MKQKNRWLPWLSAGLPLLLWAAYWRLCTHPHYELNDDVVLLRSMGGRVGGVCEGTNPHTHALLSRLCAALSGLLPTIPWFSVVQMAVCVGAMILLARGAARVIHTPAKYAALLLIVLFGTGLFLPYTTAVTYTTTSALACGAALWALLLPREGNRNIRRALTESLGWVLMAGLLRVESLYVGLAFWGLGALYLLASEREQRETLLKTSLICIGIAAAFWGVHELDHLLWADQYSLEWNRCRIAAMDYGGLAALTEADLETLGWTSNQYAMIQKWCFLDSSASLEKLAAIPVPETQRTLLDAFTQLQTLWRHSEIVHRGLWTFVATAAAAAGLSLLQQKGKRLIPLAADGLCCGGAGFLLIYLGIKGRMPARAAMLVLLPAISLLLALCIRLFSALRERERPFGVKAWIGRGCLVCVAVMLALNIVAGVQFTYNPDFGQSTSAHTELERYALAHPKELIIGNGALGTGSEIFPDWSAGRPDNLLLSWGGWNNRSEGYRAMMSRFGYEDDAFCFANFLDENARLATPQGQSPDELLLSCMEEQTGSPVEVVLEYQGEGFAIWRFESAAS